MQSTKFWGPHTWCLIHSMATTYEPQNKKAFKDLIENLTKTLPCKKCRENLKRHLQELPVEPYLKNNQDLLLWTYLLHDIVNKELGKKSPPFDTVQRYYFNIFEGECHGCKAK